MSPADIVSHWLVDHFSNGELARDAEAYQQLLDAQGDLAKAAAAGADAIDEWFRTHIAVTGPIARNVYAFNELVSAKADLVARLQAAAGDAPPAPAPAPPKRASADPAPEPAAAAAPVEE